MSRINAGTPVPRDAPQSAIVIRLCTRSASHIPSRHIARIPEIVTAISKIQVPANLAIDHPGEDATAIPWGAKLLVIKKVE
jgi:hypothetical protein